MSPQPFLYPGHELHNPFLQSSWPLNFLNLHVFPALNMTHRTFAPYFRWTRGSAFSATLLRPRRAVGSAPWTAQVPEVSISLAHTCFFPGPAGILSVQLMEGATVQLPGFPRFQESTAVSAKAELLPLRSHASFSFIIHGSKTQADPPVHSKSCNNTQGEKNDLKITI